MFSRINSVMLRLFLVVAALMITSSVAQAQGVEFVGVDKKATLTSNNTVAIVTGAVVCVGTFSVTAVIQQNHSGTNVAGQGSTPGAGTVCTGTPQPFAVQVQVINPPNATFSKGPASAIVAVNGTTNSQTVTTEVQLTE
jgi:hypothetical protein